MVRGTICGGGALPRTHPTRNWLHASVLQMEPQARTDFVLMYELDGAQHECPLTGRRLVIGRAKDCNLCFPFNTEVSRLHVVLTAKPDGWQAEDMSSRLGTLVNGERLVGPRRLRDKDVLTIGTITLTLREALSVVSGV